MSKKLWIYAYVMMLLIMNGGCARQEKEEISAFKRVTYQEIKEEAGLKAKPSNELGVAYMKKAYLENPEVNQLFSPISLSFALAMLQNGGAGKTREGILQA
ncbi:MAG: hypothetical protein JW708_09130, partial [Vallitaleaceae bacterium]|nr:hypothetical protein [Vallitaleaceae bacterium]